MQSDELIPGKVFFDYNDLLRLLKRVTAPLNQAFTESEYLKMCSSITQAGDFMRFLFTIEQQRANVLSPLLTPVMHQCMILLTFLMDADTPEANKLRIVVNHYLKDNLGMVEADITALQLRYKQTYIQQVENQQEDASALSK